MIKHKQIALWLYVCVFVAFAKAVPIGGKVCDIRTYGAVGDGVHNDTLPMLKALNDCIGGTVEVHNGTYYIFPFRLVSNVVLKITTSGKIIAPEAPDWPKYGSGYPHYITGSGISNVEITGGGTIDGRGAGFWKNSGAQRPYLIAIENSSNLSFNSINLFNSPMFFITLTSCRSARFFQVNITAPADSPNTDGIDPADSSDISIHKCRISNGDDGVAIKSGTSNVVVEECYFENGHGASIGSITGHTTENIIVRNCVFVNTVNGARIKTVPGSTGVVKNITFQNLSMTGVQNPIVIDAFYGAKPQPINILITNVFYQNITATKSKYVGSLMCAQQQPCQKLKFTDVLISAVDSSAYQCENAYGTFSNSKPAPCVKGGI